jgi:demethylmenaquinone methyltransferase / 2-methoxy-6-polyprenyl-1,4-benzoquinol methylase
VSTRSAAEKEHATRVRAMFANISARYDLLNHLLSANMDKRWRRKVVQRFDTVSVHTARVLDVACGTGDLSFAFFEATGARVIGTDFCRPMLDVARVKALKHKSAVPFVEGDALRLPFATDSFDGVTIAFGLRNLASPEDGLREFLRVTKPGGQVLVLEFSKPRWPGFRLLFQFYFHRVLPLLGGAVSGSKSAYEYLPESVKRFPDQGQLAELMQAVGFEQVDYLNLTGGVAALHSGKKPL